MDTISNSFLQKLRWATIALILLGFIIYLFGFAYGFFVAFTFYSGGFWYELNWLQFFSFTIYPKSYIIFYNSPWPYVPWFFSPLSAVIILLALFTVFLAILSKFEWFFLTMISSLLIIFIQFSLIWEITINGDLYFLGFHFTSLLSLLGSPPLYLNFLSFSNLLYILIPSIIFAAGCCIFMFLYYFDGKKLFSDLAIPGVGRIVFMRGEFFRFILTAEYMLLFLIPLFLVVGLIKKIFEIEFPAYLLINGYNLYEILYVLIVFSIGLYLLGRYLENRFRNELAREYIPILSSKLRFMKKPVISVDELRKDLGLNKVWRLVFKDVIRRMLRPANVEGLLYFGICSNIVFLKEPLVKQFKKDLNKNDFIDILGKASELEIKPGVLRGICKVLIREGFLGETKISKHRVIKIAKDKNG